ncbi:TenA family protein [Saccharolobus solfataricus]|uniref:Transcriptional activator (TenA-1) n=2 Tax=Saccharolobus solfataricus TaxID=2287 RepID=Q97WL0_SACS2|nr:TenA family protein [Saccharolobus solfataricus]AAK42376.1 Transcriptional activator (tenA-1) [Saccharolobus solfataricus P2]AKA72479.1 TenA family protein [Saccharolobus solfataricus]AKA75179.1 TenA family protein [Saccharolobus solfataricus]AKA77872.1 TenA family protein [Saccharolobus solfataricus]AZF66993.1 TenA family protein [Saccharolobus solfataricus]
MSIVGNVENLINGVGELWNKYVKHEFILKMRDGSLPLDIFRYYLIQDGKYVEDMLRALLIASSKGPIDKVTKILNLVFSSRDKGLETHGKLYSKLDISRDVIVKTGYNLINYAYTRHLYYYANLDWNKFLVAWTPCMFGYSIVGDYVIDSPNEVYKTWASFYASTEYKKRIEAILYALDEVSITEDLLNIFINSVRFEIGFWDASLRKDPTVY